MKFQDDGRFPNLAQVPARPSDLPSFAEAAEVRQSLEQNRDDANAQRVAQAQQSASQSEVAAPCLGAVPSGQTTTLRFANGSSALDVESRGALSDTIPSIRSGEGRIHIVGHGDTVAGAPTGAARFALAVARAGAVAEALAGFGIAPQRMSIVVACADPATFGASVQLYADS